MLQLGYLTEESVIDSFDCGDSDLNAFLKEDAKAFYEAHIATTFVLEDDNVVVAYFCLLNDKISREEISGSAFKRIKKTFTESKQFGSYPSVKIGRLAVDKRVQSKGIGSEVMDAIKHYLKDKHNHSAFRFLTVDAYLDVVPFYEKNHFKILMPNEDNGYTKTMFFDMLSMHPAY